MAADDVGVVMPTYLPAEVPSAERQALLRSALDGLGTRVHWPNVLVVLDGAAWMRDDVEAACASVAPGRERPTLLVLERNRGKAGAMVEGLRALLGRPLAWLAVIDCDGDHSPYDLPALEELARQVAAYRGNDRVEVVGRRVARHGGLGYVRGELEGVTSRVVFSALRYALAREQGRVLDETWLAPYGEPDLEAGYRVYSRAAAETVVEALPREAARPGLERLLWWGVEVVPTVEIVLAGGIHAEGMRSAREHQPTSSYMRGHGAEEVFSAELTWILGRCGLSVDGAALCLEDAMLRTTLRTSSEGAELLAAIQRRVLAALPGGTAHLASAPPRPARRI